MVNNCFRPQNIIEYAFITRKGRLIGMEHLSRELLDEAEDSGFLPDSPEEADYSP